MKGKKLVKLNTLHKKAWKIFSLWIRNRDNNTCFTCGKRDGVMHAGHFVHIKALDFNELNIHTQCPFCNTYRHGELGRYALNLDIVYGKGTAERLLAHKHTIHKFTREELNDIIKKYSSGIDNYLNI